MLLLEEVDPPYRQEAVTMTKASDMTMTGYFNPDKTVATRRQVNMSMDPERYYKVGEKIPKRNPFRCAKELENFKVLRVTIL